METKEKKEYTLEFCQNQSGYFFRVKLDDGKYLTAYTEEMLLEKLLKHAILKK